MKFASTFLGDDAEDEAQAWADAKFDLMKRERELRGTVDPRVGQHLKDSLADLRRRGGGPTVTTLQTGSGYTPRYMNVRGGGMLSRSTGDERTA